MSKTPSYWNKAKKYLSKKNNKPILIADIWDNPGGGVPGD